ncbi:hypothetical protein ACFPRL_17885 [Pseudoclavibacter helvolus]
MASPSASATPPLVRLSPRRRLCLRPSRPTATATSRRRYRSTGLDSAHPRSGVSTCRSRAASPSARRPL